MAMQDSYKNAGKITTQRARLCYPYLFKPQDPKKPGDKPKFGCVLLFPLTTDLQPMKTLAVAARELMWPGFLQMDPNTRPRLKNPFHQGDQKPGGAPEFKGTIYVNARSSKQPIVVDQLMQVILDPNLVYPGCYVRASLSCFAYIKDGGMGVSFGLQNIQFLADGERLGNVSNPQDDFNAVEGVPPKSTAVANAAVVQQATAARAAAAPAASADGWDSTPANDDIF